MAEGASVIYSHDHTADGPLGSTLTLVAAIFFLILWVVVWTICLIGWRVAYVHLALTALKTALSE